MFNKILVFWGLAVSAILIVENMIGSSGTAYILIWYWRVWTLVIVSLIIWWIIWYGLKWMKTDKDYKDEDLNF